MKICSLSDLTSFSAKSAIALVGASLASISGAQTSTPSVSKPSGSTLFICAPGKVPGYVATGCVNDTPAMGGQKRSVGVKGATREPVQTMIGRGVPTVNIDVDQAGKRVQR